MKGLDEKTKKEEAMQALADEELGDSVSGGLSLSDVKSFFCKNKGKILAAGLAAGSALLFGDNNNSTTTTAAVSSPQEEPQTPQ